MDQYYEWLAAHVLNDKEIVTYRTLSRALKVHVNLAKQMLWHFHDRQNAKQKGSIHATYLVSGHRKSKQSTSPQNTQVKIDEDTIMNSSPPLPGSSMPQDDTQDSVPTTVRSLLLVREEHLEQARSTFVRITGMHVYSLQPDGLSDMQVLTENTRKVSALLRTEDPLIANKQYGTIQNQYVKRRTRKTPIAEAPQARVPIATTKPEPVQSTASKPTPKPATLKKQNSNIAASFAKGASKPKVKPTAPPKAQEEDTAMKDMSDEEPADESEDVKIDVKLPDGPTKQDRQAELEAMMDVDDDMDDLEEVEKEPEENTPVQPEEEEPKETVTVEGGRRRGRRKIMKKRTVKDADGYLVTKEEAVWESFSEDEPVPKKVKTASVAPAAKKGGKPGQGNIMSFFSKK